VREIAANEEKRLEHILQSAFSESPRGAREGSRGLLSAGTLKLASETTSLRESSPNRDDCRIKNVSFAPCCQLTEMMDELEEKERDRERCERTERDVRGRNEGQGTCLSGSMDSI
jgi:hypothetical protein